MIPLYKNKGNIQNCAKYRVTKLISHTMKLWEKVAEQIDLSRINFPERSTTEVVHLLKHLMETRL